MRFYFKLAKPQDEKELRELLREIEMSGDIALSFEREPNYFVASSCGNLKSETMLVVDGEKEEIVGVASRAIRYCFIDGVKTKVGYLSNLRGKKEVRNATLLARGYKFLKKLHGDGEVEFYFSTIFSDNKIAQNILTSQRAGLPIYRDIGTIITGFISLIGKVKFPSSHIVRFSESAHSIKEVVEFINAYNSKFQYAPCYAVEDFIGENKLEGLSTDELYIYEENEEIAGVIGAWNQTGFKQVKINSYSKMYQSIRPFYNLFAKIKRVPPLPPTGSYIKNIYGSFVAIKDNNPLIFHELVNAIRYNWRDRGYAYVSIGFHEKHPLSRELLKLSSRELKSIAYEVYWDEGNISLPKESRVLHLEIGTL